MQPLYINQASTMPLEQPPQSPPAIIHMQDKSTETQESPELQAVKEKARAIVEFGGADFIVRKVQEDVYAICPVGGHVSGYVDLRGHVLMNLENIMNPSKTSKAKIRPLGYTLRLVNKSQVIAENGKMIIKLPEINPFSSDYLEYWRRQEKINQRMDLTKQMGNPDVDHEKIKEIFDAAIGNHTLSAKDLLIYLSAGKITQAIFDEYFEKVKQDIAEACVDETRIFRRSQGALEIDDIAQLSRMGKITPKEKETLESQIQLRDKNLIKYEPKKDMATSEAKGKSWFSTLFS